MDKKISGHIDSWTPAIDSDPFLTAGLGEFQLDSRSPEPSTAAVEVTGDTGISHDDTDCTVHIDYSWMDASKEATGSCEDGAATPWTPNWLLARVYDSPIDRVLSLLRVYAHESRTVNEQTLEKIRDAGEDALEMINELRNKMAKGLRRAGAHELTVMTSVFQDMTDL